MGAVFPILKKPVHIEIKNAKGPSNEANAGAELVF